MGRWGAAPALGREQLGLQLVDRFVAGVGDGEAEGGELAGVEGEGGGQGEVAVAREQLTADRDLGQGSGGVRGGGAADLGHGRDDLDFGRLLAECWHLGQQALGLQA